MSITNTRRLAESYATPQAPPRGAQRLISTLAMITLMSVGSLMGCKDKCEVSQRCDRECPEGLIPICVASSICECLDGSSSAGESAGSSAGSSAGGAVSGGESAGSMSVEPAPVCDAPAVGDLVINEVMINPSLDEPEYEYVELVNTSDREVDLSEINLTYNMTEKLRFSQGCMAPKSAVAIYSGSSSAPVEWVWSTAPRAVGYNLERFQFVNSREFEFSLFSGSGEWLSSLSGSSSLIKDGESATRLPELTGDATRHGEASSIGTLSSPAHCANGGSFEAGCSDGQMGGEPAGAVAGEPAGVMAGQTAGELAGETAGVTAGDPSGVEPPPSCPAPLIGDLLINEVLVNPAGDERTGEFIEILNLSDQEVNLEGVGLWYQSSGGVLELEVSFGRGCMAPKSALVIYNSTTSVAWTWSTETNDSATLASGHSTFQLANSRDVVLELRASSGQRMSEPMVIPASMIDEGVSANRTPDARDTDNIALHTDLNPALMTSPGGCADGSSFELGCGGTP